jgi:hypothetical protein
MAGRAGELMNRALINLWPLLLAANTSPYIQENPLRYENPVFGLEVKLPTEFVACVDGGEITTSHGFFILLQQGMPCPRSLPENRVLSAFVVFDAVRMAESVRDIAGEICGGTLKKDSRYSKYRIPGRETAVCEEELTNNGTKLTAIVLFLDRGSPPGIELQVSLITDKAHLQEDGAVFNTLLKNVVFRGKEKVR